MRPSRRKSGGAYRFIVRAAIFLLLGAVVNVAVAWGFLWVFPWSQYSADGGSGTTENGPGFSGWYVEWDSGTAWYRVCSFWFVGESKDKEEPRRRRAEEVLPSWAGSARPSGVYPEGTQAIRRLDAWGWPMLTLRSQLDWTVAPRIPVGTVGSIVTVTDGYLLPGEGAKPYRTIATVRVIPLRPMWPGFAVNTVFYCVILWLVLLAGPRALRRHIRRRRGRCLQCGYDLRGDLAAGCPECGWGRSREASA